MLNINNLHWVLAVPADNLRSNPPKNTMSEQDKRPELRIDLRVGNSAAHKEYAA